MTSKPSNADRARDEVEIALWALVRTVECRGAKTETSADANDKLTQAFIDGPLTALLDSVAAEAEAKGRREGLEQARDLAQAMSDQGQGGSVADQIQADLDEEGEKP